MKLAIKKILSLKCLSTTVFKINDISQNSVKVTKLSKFYHCFLFKIPFCLHINGSTHVNIHNQHLK